MPPCCSYFRAKDILETRAFSILHEIDSFAAKLENANERARDEFTQYKKTSTHLTYEVKSRKVCRSFFLEAHALSQKACNKIRRAVIGDESYKLSKSRVLSPTRVLKTDICVAVWSDYFKSLAPSPVAGVLLWPRKMIYALEFVDWFLRTHHTTQSQFDIVGQDVKSPPVPRIVFRDVPIAVGGSFQLDTQRATQFAKQRKHHLFDDKVGSDSDDNNYDVPPELVDKLPSFSLFCKCRHNDWFKTVKNRPKHHHAKCKTCFKLQTMCQIGWKNGVSIEGFRQELKLHNDETRSWRDLENKLHHDALHYKQSMMVISYDDTAALLLPKFTNRTPKGLRKGAGLAFVPWNISNHGLPENHYFYTVKHLIPKGSNRICTFLYYYLRRVKMFDSCQKNCQKLILMADNYIENKCNMLLCFLSQLIYSKWFTHMLLFGPVGHTQYCW